jgi:hypothetical protein
MERLSSPIGLRARPEVLTWDVCVMRIEAGPASFVACMPGAEYEGWVESFAAGELDAELSTISQSPPRRRLTRVPPTVAAVQRSQPTRVGIEQEFCVVPRRSPCSANDAVDFRPLLRAMLRDHPRRDPADPNAVRLPWGVLTADGREAEVATHPIVVEPGFAARTVGAVDRGRTELEELLPADLCGLGYSTHVNVSLDVRDDRRFAQQWASVFAPAMMLLLDGPASPGLLVRPRPGRFELCGDYCEGDRLAGAIAFAAASVVHAARHRKGRWRALAVRVDVTRAVQRFGYFVDRCAFGSDLYGTGRDTMLTRLDGTRLTAGQHLDQLIELLAGELEALGDRSDLEHLERIRCDPLALPTDARWRNDG